MAWNNMRYCTNRPPCEKDCENRTVSCKYDGTCDKYIKWSEKKDRIKQMSYDKNGEFFSYLHCKKGR